MTPFQDDDPAPPLLLIANAEIIVPKDVVIDISAWTSENGLIENCWINAAGDDPERVIIRPWGYSLLHDGSEE